MPSTRSLFGDDAAVLRETNLRLLLLANGFGTLGLTLLSPVLDSLGGPFGVTVAEVGLLMSAFMAPAVVMIPVVGVLSDRYGRKPLLTAGLVVFGGAGTAIAFTTEFRVALGLRVLQGVGFSGISPMIIASLGDLYAGSEEATAQGFRLAVSGLFQTAFPVVSSVLVVVWWQYPFALYALCLPTAALVALYLDEPTTGGGSGAVPTDGGRAAGTGLPALLGLFSHARVRRTVAVYALYPVVWIAFLTYNSIIVVDVHGGGPALAGATVAVACLCYAVTASQAGQVTAFFDGRLEPLVGSTVATSAGFVVLALAPSLSLAVAGVVLMGCGFGVAGALYRSVVTGLAPMELRGGLVSVSEAALWLTSTLTPVVVGAIVAAAAPAMGVGSAIQLAAVAVAVGGGGGSVLLLLLASASPPVRPDASG